MLRKQTMWLLTMLTLVIVLSVYYVTNPDMGTNMVQLKEDDKTKEVNSDKVTTKETTKSEFTQLRLELNDKRDQAKEDLMKMAGSKDISAEKSNELYEKIQAMAVIAEKEVVLENTLKTEGYEDVLVRAEETGVQVYVLANEHSTKEANKIIQAVRKEVGPKEVAVQFQVPKK